MRIRKHAKISPLIYAAKPGTVIQTHVCCQLNQSPWDVMTFPPSSETDPPETKPPLPPPPPPSELYQLDVDDACMGNETFADYIEAQKRAASMKFGLDDDKEKWDDIGASTAQGLDNRVPNKVKQKRDFEFESNGDETMLCCKKDGKGWQCRKKAKEGQSYCKHHSPQLKTFSNSGVKKSEKASEARRRSARGPKKQPESSSNPYEFYYYSGFGPRWGKKRGPTVKAESSYASPTSSDSSKNDRTSEVNVASFSPSLQFENEAFEVEDEENEEEEAGKKRARKPIKARSLKSLM